MSRNNKMGLLQSNSAVIEDEELVEALKETNLVEFSQELLKKKILSTEVVQTLGSLDSENLNREVTTRYLIHLICEAIATDEKLWGRLVEVLSGLGKDMRKICQKWTEDIETLATGVSKCPEDICLAEGNVSLLVGALAELAPKWRDICVALQLPSTIIDECESKGCSNSDKLHMGLTAWVEGRHKTALPRSLKSLKIALGNEDGSDEIMKKLKISLQQAEGKLDSSTCQQGGAHLAFSRQSEDQVVSEGKSTLLEVRVANTSSSLDFQWLKDGQELTDSDDHSGVTSSFLLVKAHHKKLQGNYSCRVSNKKEEISSRRISLTVTSSLQDKDLMDLYSSLDEDQDRWPLATCTFNNLTMANHKRREYLQVKERCLYKTFENVERGTLILVKGCSGAGKSMLANKLTTDWTKGRVLMQMKRVFHITTGILSTLMKRQHLSDILKIFYRDQTKQNVLLGEIERNFGKGLCFIIDGLDKPPKPNSTGIIHNLLLKIYLPEASVIVMTSTIDASHFPTSAKTVVPMELAALTHEEIFQHIDNFPFQRIDDACDGDDAGPSGLINYIHADSTVLHMCTVPVHASIACFIHQNNTCNLSTLTSLHNQFLQIHFLDQLQRKDVQSGKYLKEKSQVYFKSICKTAFQMTINQQRTFSEKEIDLTIFDFISKEDFHIDIVCIDFLSKKLGLEQTCTFLHQMLQEFLAAFHISQLESKDQEEVIREYAHKSFMKPVWRFFFGLSRIVRLSTTSLHSLISKLGLFEMHCAFESQQIIVCDRVIEASEDGCIDLSSNVLSPYDLNAMYYVISETSQHIKAISFNNCSLGDRSLVEILSQIPDNKLARLEKIHLSNNDIGSLGATALADRLQHLTKDSREEGESNSIQLQELDLSRNNLGSDGAISLIYGLQRVVTHLQELDLSHNGLGSGGAMVMLSDMIKIRNLKSLNLSHNNIGSETALLVVHGFLQNQHELHYLDLEEDMAPDNISDIKEELFEHRSKLEVRLSPSVTLRSSLRSRQSCCRIS